MNGFFSLYSTIPATRKVFYLLLSAVLFFSLPLSSQVYNYDPIRHNNFETNPACLASGNSGQSLTALLHCGLSSVPGFIYSAIKYSAYSQRLFSGIGLVLSSARLNDSVAYSYAGIGTGYRTILLRKIFFKAGFIYKINSIKAPPGSFDYSLFRADSGGITRKHTAGNVNFSLSFSSSADRYFLSAGLLNYSPSSQAPGTVPYFPRYYFVNLGNFARMLGSSSWDMSYTLFIKKYGGHTSLPLSHYITFLYRLQLTRRSSLHLGARAGVEDHSFFHYSPLISFYKAVSRSKNITVRFLFDFANSTQTGRAFFPPAIQFSLNYNY